MTPTSIQGPVDPKHYCGYCRHYEKDNTHHYMWCKPRQMAAYGPDVTRKVRSWDGRAVKGNGPPRPSDDARNNP